LVPEAVNQGIAIDEGSHRLRYIEYVPGGTESEDYSDALHTITLLTHPPLELTGQHPRCMLSLTVQERLWETLGAPPVESPEVYFACEDADGAFSSYEPYDRVAVRFNSDQFVIDLPTTRLQQTFSEGATFGSEVTLEGRFESRFVTVPARMPTPVPLSRTSPNVPGAVVTIEGATLTLRANGTYESSYSLLGSVLPEEAPTLVETGEWEVAGSTLRVTPETINEIPLPEGLRTTVAFAFRLESGQLRMTTAIDACDAANDLRECRDQAGYSYGFLDGGIVSDLTYDVALTLQRK
jgi:hypothetical protein